MMPEVTRVFNLLEEYGLTEREFSKKTGFSYSTLMDWKSGRRKPNTELVTDFCMCLGIDKATFYSDALFRKDTGVEKEAEPIGDSVKMYAYYSNKVIELGIEGELLPIIRACVKRHQAGL